MRPISLLNALYSLLYFHLCFAVKSDRPRIARTFYLAINEVDWDYSPEPNNQERLSPEPTVVDPGPWSGGRVFKKALYQEYTDESYSTLIPKPRWLGFLGPTLYAEEGEFISVVLFNNASRRYTLHTHGVLYSKEFEGAPYVDGAHGNGSSRNDVVLPGARFTYIYKAVKESCPDHDDPDCLTWMYHSHVDTVRDINSGLVGMLLTCKPGSLNVTKTRRHYTIYVSKVDETKSWYAEENVQRHVPNGQPLDQASLDYFMKFPMINGFMFGQLPGLVACVGERVTWHFAGLGTSSDIHSLSISGHAFEYFHQRTHSINVNTAEFATASSTSHKSGKWLLSCNVNKHAENGMFAFLHVHSCPNLLYPSFHVKRVRWHYIAAEEVLWDYGPMGKNGVNGESLTEPGRDSEMYFKKSERSIGGVYKKAVFRAYDDYHFKTKKIQDGRPEHLGILGPVIRAEVGDLIQVVFKNKASRPYSLHAEGVMFSKKSEGTSYSDGSRYVADNAVPPGATYTYFWFIPEDMGPTHSDPQCLTRAYTSGADLIKDTESGLIGPLLICKADTLDAREKQKNVDKEFILLMSVFDENESWYLDENMKKSGIDRTLVGDVQCQEQNKRHSINGLMYGNLHGLDMCVGDSVSWHVLTVGSTTDMHAMYFHGHSFSLLHTHQNTIGLLPGDRTTLYMKPGSPGSWRLDCATDSHPGKGEVTLYTVAECPDRTKLVSSKQLQNGRKRIFYIQAEEVKWDYAPSKRDLIYNKEIPSDLQHTSYSKILYRCYTDETFRTPCNNTGEEYMGFLGPLIRVEVGDTLKIVFRNNGPRHFSLHPTGLTYKESNSRQDQPSVAPGETFAYVYTIHDSEGPGPRDPNCINFPYYSDVDVMRDTNTGLVGTLVVCRPGTLNKNGYRTDSQRDFSIYYSIMDESLSWLAEENKRSTVSGDLQSFTAINGYIFGNQPSPTMIQWEYVDWYLMTIGDDFDLHPVHFHGNDVILYEGNDHAVDVSQLWPGIYSSVRMRAINPGKWLYHCHVNSHITSGMEAIYEVKDAPMPPSKLTPAHDKGPTGRS